jgi:hypothetical protein
VKTLLRWEDHCFYSAAEKLRVWTKQQWDIRSYSIVNSSDCDEIKDMTRVKGKLVTAGQSLTIWQEEIPQNIACKSSRINCLLYNPLSNATYLGCSNGQVFVISI